MAVTRSSAIEIARLLAKLEGPDDTARESAIARFAIIGSRAIDALNRFIDRTSDGAAVAAALRALELIADPKTLAPAVGLLADPREPVAIGAVGVLRSHLASPDTEAAVTALDRLTGVALERDRPTLVRIAALDALRDLPDQTIQPLLTRLRRDADRSIRARVMGRAIAPDEPAVMAALHAIVGGDRPARIAEIRRLAAAAAGTAPLPLLHRLLELIRAREAEEPSGNRRAAWRNVRALIHRDLAVRGSSVAVYDLRETIGRATGPLPSGFLTAVALVGDASCLDALARAHAGATDANHARWRADLVDTFVEIVQRNRLTRRHQALRRILTRWPALAANLAGRL